MLFALHSIRGDVVLEVAANFQGEWWGLVFLGFSLSLGQLACHVLPEKNKFWPGQKSILRAKLIDSDH